MQNKLYLPLAAIIMHSLNVQQKLCMCYNHWSDIPNEIKIPQWETNLAIAIIFIYVGDGSYAKVLHT